MAFKYFTQKKCQSWKPSLYSPMNDKFTLIEFPRDYGVLKHASIIVCFQYIQQYSRTKCPPWFSQLQKHCELQCFKKTKATYIHLYMMIRKQNFEKTYTYMCMIIRMNVYTHSLKWSIKYKGNYFNNKTIKTTFVHCP